MTLLARISGLALATALVLPGAASAQSAVSTQSADAALAALAPLPAPSSTSPAPGRTSVALVITPELRATVFSQAPALLRPMYQLGDANDVGQATGFALENVLENMASDVQVVASPQEASRVAGASYVLVPTIERYEEHIQGVMTFAPFVETIVVQWKVMDAKGNTVLLDTVLASATGTLGNNFVAGERASEVQEKMLDDLKAKSTTLLQPLFDGPPAQSAQQSQQSSPRY